VELVPGPLVALAGGMLGAAVAAPISAWVRWRRGVPLRRVGISTLLFVWVALQLGVGVLLLDTTWPLTGYPMYAPPQPAGRSAPVLVLTGLTADGQAVPLPTTAWFLDPLDLQARVFEQLRDPGQRDAVAARLLRQYNAARPAGALLRALRVEIEWRAVGPHGAERWREPLLFYEEDVP